MALPALLFVAACGGDHAERRPPAPSAAGPGLTVAEALESDAEGEVLVRGALYARGGDIRLCEALAESYPPQCGGPSLQVQGLALSDVEGLDTAEGVSWTDTEIKLIGLIRGHRLFVSDTAL